VEQIAQHCDLVFCDMKFADSARHQEHTGVPNELIKENLKKLRAAFPELEIIVRTPVVPGINDDEENILGIVEFLKDIPIQDYELLAFHNFGAQKYDQLGKDYSLHGLSNVQKTDIEPYNNLMRQKLGLLSKTN
jgi:pyruvate formate lyase activating enzyme